MGRDAAAHASVIGFGMTAFVETDQDKNEKDRPANKKRAHEPMREFENVIDLVAVLGCVRRLSQKFVDERETIHPFPNLPSVARAAALAFVHVARS